MPSPSTSSTGSQNSASPKGAPSAQRSNPPISSSLDGLSLRRLCYGPPSAEGHLDLLVRSLADASPSTAGDVIASICRLLAGGSDGEGDQWGTRLTLPLRHSPHTAAMVAEAIQDPILTHQLLIPLLRQWHEKETALRLQPDSARAAGAADGRAMLKLQWALTDSLVDAALYGDYHTHTRAEGRQPHWHSHASSSMCAHKCRAEGVATVFTELVEATRSFRVSCAGSLALMHDAAQSLLLDQTPWVSTTGSDDAQSAARAITHWFAHRHADGLLRRWIDYLSRTTGAALYSVGADAANVRAAAVGESSWLFLCCLLAGTQAVVQEMRRGDIRASSLSSARSALAVDAVEAFTTRLMRHQQFFLRHQLPTGRNVLAHRPLFWEALSDVWHVAATTEVEDHTKTLQIHWGSVFAAVEALTAWQPPDEEDSVTAALSNGGDSGTFAIRDAGVLEAMRQLYMQCNARCRAAWEATYTWKRPRAPEENQKHLESKLDGVDQANPTPAVRLDRYLSTVFYEVYHPSCFTLLRLELQRALARGLRRLADLILKTPAERRTAAAEVDDHGSDTESAWESADEDAVHSALTMHAVGEPHHPLGRPTAVGADVEEQTRCRTMRLLSADARLTMLLSHAFLTILGRRGKVSAEDEGVLAAQLLPMLVELGNANAAHEEARGLPSGWSVAQQATFCLLMLVNSGLLLALPWSVDGVYLALQRYVQLSHAILQQHNGEAAPVLAQLYEWLDEGGGGPHRRTGSSVAAACDEIDDAVRHHDAFYASIAEGDLPSDTALDEHMRLVTPLRLPPPCGTLLVVATYRNLAHTLYQWRNAWEEQRRLAEGGDARDYLGRTGTLCTSLDVRVFRTVVRLTHRMVFAFQLQPVGLLRLWLGYLWHLFTTLVPCSDSEESWELMPYSWQLRQVVNCLGETVERRGWRALRPTQNTSQTALRMILGELLVDLALLPCVDRTSLTDCPAAVPWPPQLEAWRSPQQSSESELQAVQRLLPHAVLEEVCLILGIDTEQPVPVGGGVKDLSQHSQSLLGLSGLVAMCKRLDEVIVPGSITNARLAHLIRCLWAAADQQALSQ